MEFLRLNAIDLAEYRNLHSSAVYGTLGLVNINADVYLCVISGAIRVATVRPGETIQRILSVDFCQSPTLVVYIFAIILY